MDMQRASYFLVLAVLFSANAWASDLGKEWVRSHDFTVSALVVVPDNLDVYTVSGLNMLLGWEFQEDIYSAAAANNLPWSIHAVHKKDLSAWRNETNPVTRQQLLDGINASIAQERQETAQLIGTYQGNEALYLWDEAKPDELDFLDDSVRWAKAMYPDKLVYTSLNAYNTAAGGCGGDPGIGYDYSDHVADVIGTGIDVISANPYPFYSDTTLTANYLRCRYFSTLESIRNKAVAASIPYWIFAQSTDEGAYYLPSQSDLRLALFAPLAYGFTGIQLYMYYHPDSDNIVKADRAEGIPPDYNYAFNHYVSDAVSEIAHLGRTLRHLKSQLVRHVRSHPSGVVPWGTVEFEGTPTNPVGGIASIELSPADTANHGLIGFFEDDYHHNYFMLVNSRRAANTLAWDTRLEFTLQLHPSITSLYKMNRDTGQVENVPIVNNSVTLSVLGGTGELFKVNSSSFIGLN